jgi:hypothetical protein
MREQHENSRQCVDVQAEVHGRLEAGKVVWS